MRNAISLIVLSATVGAVFAIVAGVVTPIGLAEAIVAGSFVTAKFEYAVDSTPLGSETPPRTSYFLSRICADGILPCPGVEASDFKTIKSWDEQNSTIFESYVSPNISGCFRGGVKSRGDFRASPFEIQFRHYQSFAAETDPANSKYDGELAEARMANTTGSFQLVESLVLLDQVINREGIVADLVNGGVGFRNHTVPTRPRLKYGAKWTEDILWMEPVTECIDTNWSVGLGQQLNPVSSYNPLWTTNLWLVNRGGGLDPTQFSDFKRPLVPPSQLDPGLLFRAHTAGSIFNFRLSQLLHLQPSNSSVGQKYNSVDWAVWDMLKYAKFNKHQGFILAALQDPTNNPMNRGPWQEIDWMELDPALFNLSAFDVNAFLQQHSLLETPLPNSYQLPVNVSMEHAGQSNPTLSEIQSQPSRRIILTYCTWTKCLRVRV